jgi:hypothetical protein
MIMFLSLKEYFVHVDGICLSMWKIFGLCGKNIIQRLCVTHKKLTHHSQVHRLHSCAHMVALLHTLQGGFKTFELSSEALTIILDALEQVRLLDKEEG